LDQPDWDEYFCTMAKLVSTRSKDQNTKIGAVIVGADNEVLSTGYNSFPRGLNDDLPERQKSPEKYFWFEHAERNAIFNAARHGAALKGSRMYLNCYVPCTDCTRAIIQAGIVEVILGRNASKSAKWAEHAEKSKVMLKEAGVHWRIGHIVEGSGSQT
jgi:dCMP deaminase